MPFYTLEHSEIARTPHNTLKLPTLIVKYSQHRENTSPKTKNLITTKYSNSKFPIDKL